METEDRGYAKGMLVTLCAVLVSGFLVKTIASMLLGIVAETILMLIAIALSVLFFGTSGLRTIAVGYKGVPLLFGKRIQGIVYPEGIVWTWPKPIGDIMAVDTRDKTMDLPLTEVLTEDSVPVAITIALQIKVTDIFKYLDADKPEASLINSAESDIRSIALLFPASNIAQERQVISNALRTGVGGEATPLEGKLFQGLSDSKDLWGISVSQVRITHIRLPKELEDARTDIQVRESKQQAEIADAKAEMVEAEHIAKMLAVYKAAGLSPTEGMNMIQSERGKATRIILDGGADPLVKAGALAGGILPTGNSDGKNRRRRQ